MTAKEVALLVEELNCVVAVVDGRCSSVVEVEALALCFFFQAENDPRKLSTSNCWSLRLMEAFFLLLLSPAVVRLCMFSLSSMLLLSRSSQEEDDTGIAVSLVLGGSGGGAAREE
jgi:hypothetical protein